MRLDPPALVMAIADAIHAAGGRAWLVGGGVRDHLMQLPVKDWDLEAYGLVEDALLATLRQVGRVDLVGRAFGVYKLHRGAVEVDVSIPRRDSNVGPGHKGIHVEGDPFMDPKEAARRRDLTINAIMLDVRTGEVLDPWGGEADLGRGVLRAVDAHTFLEDPLRALRVVQFCARLGFEVDAGLRTLCRQAALDELPAERIQAEWAKLMLKGRMVSRGLALAHETGVLERAFPEAVGTHTAAPVLDRLVGHRDTVQPQGRRFALMLAGWLHTCDPDAISATLDRLWLHKWQGYALRQAVLRAVACLNAPVQSDADLRNLSTRTELEVTLLVRDAVGDAEALEALERARALEIAHVSPPRLLQGRHLKGLGVAPGPDMGRLVKAVYQQQLDGAVTTVDEAVQAARALIELEQS